MAKKDVAEAAAKRVGREVVLHGFSFACGKVDHKVYPISLIIWAQDYLPNRTLRLVTHKLGDKLTNLEAFLRQVEPFS